MERILIDMLQEWHAERSDAGLLLEYPKPENAKGFYPYGFVQKNDGAADFVGWYGLSLQAEDCCEEVELEEHGEYLNGEKHGESLPAENRGGRPDTGQGGKNPTEEAEVSVTVFFAEQKPLKTTVKAVLRGKKAQIEIPFSLFPLETARKNRWEFVTGILIACKPKTLKVTGCAARRREGVYVKTDVRGRSGRIGERLNYEGRIYNCADGALYVTADQVFEGWESMIAQIALGDKKEAAARGTSPEIAPEGVRNVRRAEPEPEAGSLQPEDLTAEGGNPYAAVILQPGDSVGFAVEVTVSDLMVPGGHENTQIRVRGQGAGRAYEERVTLRTLCCLPHPYLYHDGEGWRRVKENIDRHAPYQPAFEAYRRTAQAWEVTDPMEGRDFCYETKTENALMSAGYMYALTGERSYAEKLADFFRRFSDPQNGYPARKKGCSQAYVQEGHFFKHLAVCYDLICESGVMTEKDKLAVERCFRLYMEMLDVHVLDGRISNWIVSELQGALFCALVLQDMDRALRFAFGSGGIIEQFRYGIFNDGWWHECSVGYNTWVSSIMLHTAHALLPFGYNLIHTRFRIPFNREVSSVYGEEAAVVKSGMYNQKWGGNQKNYACIKEMFDATLPFLDYRGVLFGIADSDEKRLSGAHFGSTYDLAYHYYKDPKYLPVIRDNEPDPIFGDPDLTFENAAYSRENACADNIGLALLRSKKADRPQREQIQAVLRYGSHGNAHGHFDITELLSVMRYGRSFFNPENCWWGYAHFMYKFYVQCSLTKNMVVVDEKMQVPADSRRILWHSEDGLQAAGVEVKTRWSYPPYGGMVYEQDGQTATKEELRKRCRQNGCFLPVQEGEGSPVYGEMSGYTEEILQKRIMAVTDDYIVFFDYVEGQEAHQYDSLMQIKGFLGIEGEQVEHVRHTEQMNENPVSDAQFITDCHWYSVQGGSTARFLTVFTEEHAGERLVCDRSNYNEPGKLYMDVHTAWPPKTEQMVGRVAVYEGWAADANGYTIPLSYELKVDGRTADAGAFDGWILGRGELDADISGASSVTLSVFQGAMHDEIGNPVKTPQGIFWGKICLRLEDGSEIDLGKCLLGEDGIRAGWAKERVRMENVDTGCGIGRDYKNGRVTIVGTEYPYAVPASPADHGQESRIVLDLSGIPAAKLNACIGVDAFPGDEWQKRKTYAVRTHGRTGRFITVIEPYEAEAMIGSVEAKGPDSVTVTLKDKSRQQITVEGMETKSPRISWKKLC